MPPNQPLKTKGRAVSPDPNRSLFKFKLTWLPEPNGYQKKSETWYSFDYPIEREMFPEGLDKDLRAQWKTLVALCWKHPELYEFIKWLRPHNKDDDLVLYMPNWDELPPMIPVIEAKYGWGLLENYVHTCGFNDFSFCSVDRSHPRQAGNSPGKTKVFREFYGYKYIHRNDFIVRNLAIGKLLKVDVYDNLMYHSENHLHTMFGRVQTVIEPEHLPVRGGTPQAIGSMMPKFNRE
ncbi:hypothetical protein SAMN04487996_12293 [Dyadobacter soli]|uniref:Uncharacterized protein n=1 Tax=Dyadobacter soli TaxID=659014 RepID=A0A1G7WLI6_9BACT|nr:hypothetical protein [Dyadobacter soli]SDG72803.1 hypothetical protein SAMN04487996_12293 [Dyadobacter soli]